MRHRHPLDGLACPAAALALALLGGCAEVHHGVEAVGRVGPASSPVAEADAPPPRPDVKTVRPAGTPRPVAGDPAVGASPALASAVPSPREIFDFHPAGSGPNGWRQPFVIDTSDGPLAADVRRSSAELRAFLADQKAGVARTAAGATGSTRPRCGEDDYATGKPGCGPAAPRAAAAAPQ